MSTPPAPSRPPAPALGSAGSFREARPRRRQPRAAGLRALRVHPLPEPQDRRRRGLHLERQDPFGQAGHRAAQGLLDPARRLHGAGRDDRAGGQREAREEACATIEIDRLLAMYSVARIGQVQIMYRARLVSADVAAGPGERGSGAGRLGRHPWEQLAFPTVVWALAHFHDRAARPTSRPTQIPRATSPACGRRASLRASKAPLSAYAGQPPFALAGFTGFCYHLTNVR